MAQEPKDNKRITVTLVCALCGQRLDDSAVVELEPKTGIVRCQYFCSGPAAVVSEPVKDDNPVLADEINWGFNES